MAHDAFNIVGTTQGGAFRVVEVVAEGGFAVIYRAHHEGFRADVALKCLRLPGSLSTRRRQQFLQKFREEAELLFRLSAAIPAVVRPLHYGTIENRADQFIPFMALEWLEGETLNQWLRRRRAEGKPPLGVSGGVELLGPCARALARAHAFPGSDGPLSILHRDLKPDNVFLAMLHGQHVLKILDFGIAKVKSAASQIAGLVSVEETEFAAFTPSYGAPEQWLPKRFGQTGTWTDVWGLALTLVEVITGRTPLQGDAHSLMGAVLDNSTRPTPRNCGFEISDELEAVFEKALAVDPRRRYRTMTEFWDAVEAVVGVTSPRAIAGEAALESVPAGLIHSSPHFEFMDRDAPLQHPQRTLAHERRTPFPTSSLRGPAEIWSDEEQPPGSALEPLDGVGIMPGTEATRPRVYSAYQSEGVLRNNRSVYGRILDPLTGPLKTLIVGLALVGADWAYSLYSGSGFVLGPLNVYWVAGPLVLYSVLRTAVFVLGQD